MTADAPRAAACALSLCLSLSACAGTPAPPSTQPGPARPNVLLVLADDLGFGDLHANAPASTLATPTLDGLAADGLRFVDAHSPSSVCTPTRYGLLTGRYAWRTRLQRGVLGGYDAPLIDAQRPTLASRLAAAGYRTAAIGKWHLGMDMPLLDGATLESAPWSGDPGVDFAKPIGAGPLTRGFERYFGVAGSLDMPPYVYVRDDRFTAVPTLEQPAVPFPHFVRQGPRAADFVIDEALDRLVLEARAFLAEAAGGDAPFFLYLPLTSPHKPTQPHPRFRGTTGLGEYGDLVAQVDWSIGQVLAALDEHGLADDTLVIVTSDNGSYMHRFDEPAREDHVDRPGVQGFRAERHRSNGPFRGTKADIWEAGHRVPLLVRWPGRVAPGAVCSRTVCLTDWYATLAELLELPLANDEAEDSLSLAPLLRGEDVPRGAPVVHHSVGGMFALRDGPWKLVCGNGSGGRERPAGEPFGEPFQLYDLAADPGETRDLAAQHPELVRRLYARLEELRAEGRSAPPR